MRGHVHLPQKLSPQGTQGTENPNNHENPKILNHFNNKSKDQTSASHRFVNFLLHSVHLNCSCFAFRIVEFGRSLASLWVPCGFKLLFYRPSLFPHQPTSRSE